MNTVIIIIIIINPTILLLTVESQVAPDATPHRLSGCCCDL